jgi:hypothetical protein
MAKRTSPPKRIVVTGDVTIDWNLARTLSGSDGSSGWNADDCTHAYCQRGGAAMLAELINVVAGDVRKDAGGDWKVFQPDMPKSAVSIEDPRFHHSYALWSLFDQGRQPARDGRKQAWRVKEFLGLNRCCAAEAARRAAGMRVHGGPESAEILVLDDADLGFRDHPGDWPLALKAKACRWVVLKVARPVADGRLWTHLRDHLADRLIVVMTANDLRQASVKVARDLSWERTAEDLARELVYNPRVNALFHCSHVVVSFGTAGALLHRGPASPKRGSGGTAPACRLCFDPFVLEGEWADDYPGGMIGYTSCLVAGIVRQLMLSPASPDIDLGIRAGLAAMRTLHREGYGEPGTTAECAKLAFPSRRIASEIALDPTQFAAVEVPKPACGCEPLASAPQPLPPTAHWTILESRYPRELGSLAERIVLEGPEAALKGIPIGRFGALLTVDRREIEAYRSIRSLILEYSRKEIQQPLSIAVFGGPGSGKSFGVTEVAKAILPGQIQKLGFNLSQFDSPEGLLDAFHRVRDVALSGKLPLVFWDEFDSALQGDPLGWLAHFLAPMQDGEFLDGQIVHPIGRSIFVFAGGTSTRLREFGAGLEESDFRSLKGPDFLSRIKGFVDILGPNPGGWATPADPYFIIRRAVLLRSILSRNARQVFDSAPGKPLAHIDPGVMRAFLHVSAYKHGVRSMETIVAMSGLRGKRQFERSALPPAAQLDLHVDGGEFLRLAQQIDLPAEVLDRLAVAVHQAFCDHLKRKGYRYGSRTNDKTKTHSSLRPFADLPRDEQEQNRGNARDIPNKLALIGCFVTLARRGLPPLQFSADDLERLAEKEHDRWVMMKLQGEWHWARRTDKSRRLHRDLLAWRPLPDEERIARYTEKGARAMGLGTLSRSAKEKDRALVRDIPKVLAAVGYTAVHVGS